MLFKVSPSLFVKVTTSFFFFWFGFVLIGILMIKFLGKHIFAFLDKKKDDTEFLAPLVTVFHGLSKIKIYIS